MPEALFPIIIFGCPLLAMIVMMILGCVEAMRTRTLRKYGEQVEGYIEEVDLKAERRPIGIYGKVSFTYRVNEKTYTRRQTVPEEIALAFLTARPLFSGSEKVSVLFLPRRPRVARLAISPSDHARIRHALLSMIILLVLVALFLILVFASVNRQPTYY